MPATVKKQVARLALDNGTDTQGNPKYVNVNIGDMSETGFNPSDSTSQTKLLQIAAAMENVLANTVARVEAVTTTAITPA